MKSYKNKLYGGAINLLGKSHVKQVLHFLIKFVKKNKKTLSVLVFIIFFSLLFRNVISYWHEVRSFSWQITPTLFLLIFISALAVYPVNIICWHLLVKTLGVKIAFFDNAKVWMISNAARFLPGGIWQYPGRVYLMSQKGMSKRKATAATILEVALNLIVGGIVVILTIFPSYSLLLIIGIPVAFVFTKKFTNLNLIYLCTTIVSFFIKFIVTGFVLVFLFSAAMPLTIHSAVLIEGIFALSWLAGYIVIFAPGGIGVTEVSLASLMSLMIPMGIGVASALALAYRFVLIMSEVVFFVITLLIDKKKANKYH